MSSLKTEYQLSQYTKLCSIDYKNKVFLVRHTVTEKIYIEKSIALDKISIYQSLMQITHSNLPKIHAVFECENEAVIIEEYLTGQTLREFIDEKILLKNEDVIYIINQICDAVDILHSEKIIHRDINPNNIMITKDYKITLFDFDISRMRKDNTSTDTEILGTKGYVAPEQFGFMQTDKTADIYSIGMVLKELCDKNLNNTTFRKSLMEGVSEQCMKFNPSERYKTTIELKTALNGRICQEAPTLEKVMSVLPGIDVDNKKTSGWNVVIYGIGLLLTIILLSDTSRVREFFQTIATSIFLFFIPISWILGKKEKFSTNRFLNLFNKKWKKIIYVLLIIISIFIGLFLISSRKLGGGTI